MNLKEVKMVTLNDKFYLLSNETNNKYFIFSINGELTEAEFDDLIGDQIDWVMNIAVEPEQIGLVYIGAEGENHKISNITNEHISNIMSNNGKCFIEMMNPEDYDHLDLELGKYEFTPILLDNKVIIHLNDESQM